MNLWEILFRFTYCFCGWYWFRVSVYVLKTLFCFTIPSEIFKHYCFEVVVFFLSCSMSYILFVMLIPNDGTLISKSQISKEPNYKSQKNPPFELQTSSAPSNDHSSILKEQQRSFWKVFLKLIHREIFKSWELAVVWWWQMGWEFYGETRSTQRISEPFLYIAM